VEDGGEGLAPVEGLPASEVSRAEDCADLVGRDHLLVFSWYFVGPHRDMEVSQDECELAHLFLFCHVVKYPKDYNPRLLIKNIK
jgi:hypothetical protein